MFDKTIINQYKGYLQEPLSRVPWQCRRVVRAFGMTSGTYSER
jgi:hypothetical protein